MLNLQGFLQLEALAQIEPQNYTNNESLFIDNFSYFFTNKLKNATSGQIDVFAEELKVLVSKADKSNRFVRSSLNNAALQFHFSEENDYAVEFIDLAFQFPSAMPGSDLLLLNQKAEFLKGMQKYQESIDVCEKILENNEPSQIRDSMHQAARTRIADLTLMLHKELTDKQRIEVEHLLKPFTEVANTGPNSEHRGQLMRSRIENLKSLGLTHESYLAGKNYIESNITDEFSGYIAADILALTNGYSSSPSYKQWMDYFKENSVPSNNGIMRLKYIYFNALAREGKFEDANTIGEQLLSVVDKNINGMLRWNTPGTKTMLETTMNVVRGEIGRKTELVISNTHQKQTEPTVKYTFYSIFIIALILFYSFYSIFKRNGKLNQNV